MASNRDYNDKKGGTIREETKGFGQRVKGEVKEGWGRLTNQPDVEREGRLESDMGKARQDSNEAFGSNRDFRDEPAVNNLYGSTGGTGGNPDYGLGSPSRAPVHNVEQTGSSSFDSGTRTDMRIEPKTDPRYRDTNPLSSSTGSVSGSSDYRGTSTVGAADTSYGGDTGLRAGDTSFRSQGVGDRPVATDARGRLVTSLFTERAMAERAYNDLRTRYGYSDRDISIMMSDETRRRHFGDAKPGEEFKEGSKAAEGLGVGSAIGGTLGAIVGGIAAIGTNVLVPGLGLVVAGPLAAALAGAGAGGAVGGLLGALIGSGIPEERAREYEKGIQQGGILIGAHARSDEQARILENEFRSYGGRDIKR